MMLVCFRKGGHPAYDDMLNYPPEGVKYKEVKMMGGMETPFVPLRHKIKRFLFKFYTERFSNVNAIPILCNGDIIYSCGIMVKSNKPWVSDFEHALNVIGGPEYRANRRRISSTIRHIEKSECKLLGWSKAAVKSAEVVFGNRFKEINDKFDVVYPALHLEFDISPKKSNDYVTFLYVSRVFWGKCGMETLMAFDEIRKKYDTKLIFISDTPTEVKNKFTNDNIVFIDTPVSREEVLKYYSKSDIFILPTLFDTFGYVYLEAMSFGLPVIATSIFAVPEIVEDERSGLLVSPEYSLFNGYDYRFGSTEELYEFCIANPQNKLIERLEKAMIRLIENDKERTEFGKYGRWLVENGKFSIKYRNKKLKEIFNELLK